MKKNKIKVASVQMRFRSSLSENVEWILETIRSTARRGAEAILFPECAVTGYNCDFAKLSGVAIHAALALVARAARASRCSVLIGCPTIQKEALQLAAGLSTGAGRKCFDIRRFI